MTNALLRLAFAMAPVFTTLTKPLPISRRLILQQERSQTLSRSPTACKLMVSCSFHSPPGVLFTFPSRYCFTIGHSGIFSLTRWSSQIHTGFPVPHATWDKQFFICIVFDYKTFTFFGTLFQTLHLTNSNLKPLSHNPNH